MATLKKRSVSSEKKSCWTFSLSTVEMYWKYVVSAYVTIADLNRMMKFMNLLDMDAYKFMDEIFPRLQLISLYVNARCNEVLEDIDVIKSYILENDSYGVVSEILPTINFDPNQLKPAEIRRISEDVANKIKYNYIMVAKEPIEEEYKKLSDSDFYSVENEVNKMREIFSTTLISIQNAHAATGGMIRELNICSPEAHDLMETIVAKAHRPSATLTTGIRQLNAILAGGFQSGRLYTFLGNTGGFKSGTLLNMADQIRKFNPQLTKEWPGKRKTILFITMENSIDETIERLYDMYSPVWSSGIPGVKNGAEISQLLHDEGGFPYENEPGIDIAFRYYQDMEINTNDLYNIMQEYDDQNREVICVVLDYIKRINSPRPWNGDERIRLGYVSKELNNFAKFFSIPVITAMQTNREGNTIIDAAIREDKQDVAKFLGASNIGSSWAIMEDSDWVCLINREIRHSDKQMFLTFKRLKIRGKTDATVADYFNYPFTNEKYIRLESDVNEPFSKAIRSLASDLEAAPEMNPAVTQNRPKLGGNGKPKSAKEILSKVGMDDM